MTKVPTQFMKPDDFAPCKGRAGRYYCKLCTPPGHAQGQAMTLSAALRHESNNEKHLKMVHEACLNEWAYESPYESPASDWAPPRLAEGENAWEQSSSSERATDFIEHWLSNIAAEDRGEPPESMDSFIDRYNQKYQDWVEQCERDVAAWKDGGKGDEPEDEKAQDEPAEEHGGWSYEPSQEGQPGADRPPKSIEVDARALWGFHVGDFDALQEDPYVTWGVSPDEVTPWDTVPSAPARASDTPAYSQYWPKTGPQRTGRQDRKRGGRGRHGGQKKNGGVVEGTAVAWRTQQGKIQTPL